MNNKIKLTYIVHIMAIFLLHYPAGALGSSDASFNDNPACNEEVSTINELSADISRKLQTLQSISFSFKQYTYIADSTQTVNAKVCFEKPGNLKVKYYKPQPQEIYLTEGYLYTYIPKIKQSTRQKINNINDILGIAPSVIFSDKSFDILMKDFRLQLNPGLNSGRLVAIEAEPLDKSNFDKITIYFDRNTGLPEKSVIAASNFKSVTMYSEYDLNPVFKSGYFDFKPASDVNVINID